MKISPHQKALVGKVRRSLKQDYPSVECALTHDSPLQLLVATILSAQCTDERVNKVTPELFRRFPTAEALARAPLADLEKAIQSTGFFRNKAKNIQGCCRELMARYDGEVPAEMAALVQLPGVGRKTASVVLGVCFGLAEGVVVDTHVSRLSQRMGLTRQETPEKIEQDLMAVLPRTEWIVFSHRMIHHGRQICKARKPLCEECSLASFCPRVGVTE